MFKNYKRKKEIERKKELLKSAAIGGVITGAAVSLLTPKSGKELRKNIADTAAEGKKKTCELLGKCHYFPQEKTKETGEKAKHATEELIEKKDEVGEKIKDKTDGVKDKTADKIEEVAEDLKEGKE